MRTAYTKVWRDLWGNKGRTLLVVLSVGVGVFAVGMINAMRTIMADSMQNSHRVYTPAHIVMGVRSLSEAANPRGGRRTQSQNIVGGRSPIDDDLLFSLGRLPGIEGVDGVISTNVRWKLNLDDPWETGALYARNNYEHQVYDHLVLYEGRWPERDTLAVEHNSVSGYGVPPAGTIYFELNDRPQAVQREIVGPEVIHAGRKARQITGHQVEVDMIEGSGVRIGAKEHLAATGIAFALDDTGGEVQRPRKHLEIRNPFSATLIPDIGRGGCDHVEQRRRCAHQEGRIRRQRHRLDVAINLEWSRLVVPVENVRVAPELGLAVVGRCVITKGSFDIQVRAGTVHARPVHMGLLMFFGPSLGAMIPSAPHVSAGVEPRCESHFYPHGAPVYSAVCCRRELPRGPSAVDTHKAKRSRCAPC